MRKLIPFLLCAAFFGAFTMPLCAQQSSDTAVKTAPIRRFKALYPYTVEEINEEIEKINARTAKGVDPAQQKGLNAVNIYRFLSGCATYNVKFSESDRKEAQEAAEACAAAGKIDHGLGHYTNVCNLNMNSQDCSPAMQTKNYMDDHGDNNRQHRGHRAQIMSPNLETTAFGIKGIYGAQRIFTLGDGKTKTQKKPCSHPGRGLQPKEYYNTDGWSYYQSDKLEPTKENVKVEVWLLSSPPTKALSKRGVPVREKNITVKEVKVKAVFVDYSRNSVPNTGIVFEPDVPKRFKGGEIYCVRVTIGKFSDQYVVEFF